MNLKGILSYVKSNSRKVLIIGSIIIFLIIVSVISIYLIIKHNRSVSTDTLSQQTEIINPMDDSSTNVTDNNQEQSLPLSTIPDQIDTQTDTQTDTQINFQPEFEVPSIIDNTPQPVSQPVATPINPTSGTLISDTVKPLIESNPDILLSSDSISQPVKEIETITHQAFIPDNCEYGFYSNSKDIKCLPCKINNQEGIIWTSVGTEVGNCEYKCADGYSKHPSGEGCKKNITEKPQNIKEYNSYTLECKNTINLNPYVGGLDALIRILYYGKISSNIPIFISNMRGDIIKINDVSDGANMCDLGVLRPRKYVSVKLPYSRTGEYIMAVGGPAQGDKITTLRAYQQILGKLNFLEGSVKNLGIPSEEVISWLPPQARSMRFLYFSAPQKIANIIIKVEKA